MSDTKNNESGLPGQTASSEQDGGSADSAGAVSPDDTMPAGSENSALPEQPSGQRKNIKDISSRTQYILLMVALALLTAAVCAAAVVIIRQLGK